MGIFRRQNGEGQPDPETQTLRERAEFYELRARAERITQVGAEPRPNPGSIMYFPLDEPFVAHNHTTRPLFLRTSAMDEPEWIVLVAAECRDATPWSGLALSDEELITNTLRDGELISSHIFFVTAPSNPDAEAGVICEYYIRDIDNGVPEGDKANTELLLTEMEHYLGIKKP